jgi:hypothetical protein
MTFADPRLARLDGFRVEIDAERERANRPADRQEAFERYRRRDALHCHRA